MQENYYQSIAPFFHLEYKVKEKKGKKKKTRWAVAIDPCRGWMVPREEGRQALGRGLWLLSSEPVVRAPTCLQTFFFFSPSDFKIKIKNFKKEFKEKKRKKDFCRKETYFQNADPLLQSSGIEQCCFPLRPSSWTLVDCPLRRGDELWSLSCTRGRALRKTRVPEGQLHTISCILPPNS